jgi:hypothetical protein
VFLQRHVKPRAYLRTTLMCHIAAALSRTSDHVAVTLVTTWNAAPPEYCSMGEGKEYPVMTIRLIVLAVLLLSLASALVPLALPPQTAAASEPVLSLGPWHHRLWPVDLCVDP